jgi:hypothetical protein
MMDRGLILNGQSQIFFFFALLYFYKSHRCVYVRILKLEYLSFSFLMMHSRNVADETMSSASCTRVCQKSRRRRHK